MGVMFPVMGGIKLSSLLTTIAEAVGLLSDLPGAASALKRIQEAILNLRQQKSDNLDEDSAFGQLVKAEEENLRRLIKEFSDILGRSDLDTEEKERARRRLAAQLCALLQKLKEVFRNHIREYASLVLVFCQYASSPAA